MNDLPHPKRYIGQYLLIPFRIILVVPLLAGVLAVSLFIKAFLTAIGLVTMGILLGAGWLIDTYVWSGFSKSPLAVIAALLLMYPTWLIVAYVFGGITNRIGSIPLVARIREPLTKAVGNAWEWLIDFVFEAKYKQPYVEMFGPNFPEPKFSDFNLDKEDYYAYNRRFEFGEWANILGIAAAAFMMWYLYDERFKGQVQILNILIGLGSGILTYFILKAIDSWYAKRFPQHEQVRQYSYAKEIYDTIQEDIRKAKHKIEFEKKWAAKMELEAKLKKAK